MHNERPIQAAELLRILSDDTRRRLVGLLSVEDSYVELLASRLGLTPATVCYHLKKLEAAGVVRCSRSQFYIIYALNREILTLTVGDLLADAIPAPDPNETYEREVIAHFFKYGRLVRLPSQQKKQRIVLCEVARRFHPDTDYPEHEVNVTLAAIFDDVCTLRRALISTGLMTRRANPGGEDIYRLT